MTKVTIVDYGMGNLLSVSKALEKCLGETIIAETPTDVANAGHLILPGVGAFAKGIKTLNDRGFSDAIRNHVTAGKPMMGICLGMQFLFAGSKEHGSYAGLEFFPDTMSAIPQTDQNNQLLRTPHVGWNELMPAHNDDSWSHSILDGIQPGNSVYFVHSYYAKGQSADYNIANCDYGGHSLSAVVAKDALVGCQFHPEKSGIVGLNILANFLRNKF
jgi:glutamine amidotransferase